MGLAFTLNGEKNRIYVMRSNCVWICYKRCEYKMLSERLIKSQKVELIKGPNKLNIFFIFQWSANEILINRYWIKKSK